MIEREIIVAYDDMPSTLFRRVRDEALDDGLGLDTETTGLKVLLEKLRVVSFSTRKTVVVVAIDLKMKSPPVYTSQLIANQNIEKIVHNVAFDGAFVKHHLSVDLAPVFCTKVAARLAGVSRNPQLKTLSEGLLGITLDKEQQLSDWSQRPLTPEQILYAAGDVLHLHDLREALEAKLHFAGKTTLFRQVMDFAPVQANLQLLQFDDIFAYKQPEVEPQFVIESFKETEFMRTGKAEIGGNRLSEPGDAGEITL